MINHTSSKIKSLKSSDFISLLKKTKGKKRRLLLDCATKNQISAIVNCIKKALVSRTGLSQKEKFLLKKYKNKILKLCNPKTSIKHKKKILQKGGMMSDFFSIPLLALAKFTKLVAPMTGIPEAKELGDKTEEAFTRYINSRRTNNMYSLM